MNEIDNIIMRKQQKILGILGIMLPVLCVGFGVIGYLRGVNYPGWYESISATYYSNSRMMMIGLLFAIGIYYWSYKGYDKLDDIITSISAAMAICIVAFPCSDSNATSEEYVGILCLPREISGYLHSGAAVVFYITFLIQTLRFTKGSSSPTSQKRRRNRVFYCCAAMMVLGLALMLLAVVLPALKPYHFFILIGECFLQLAVGTAWLVKAGCITALNDK